MRSVSFLRIFFSIILFCCILFAALSWRDLTENGTSLMQVFEISIYSFFGLLLDFVMKIFVRNKKDKRILSVIIIIAFSYFLVTKLNII